MITQNNLLGYIIKYESGKTDEEEMIELFQYLVDTGQAWTLQGHYGRTAEALIEAGYVTQTSDSESCDCG